jgi:hypothetical protein
MRLGLLDRREGGWMGIDETALRWGDMLVVRSPDRSRGKADTVRTTDFSRGCHSGEHASSKGHSKDVVALNGLAAIDMHYIN